ncbi:MAG: hypothetical protein FWG68_01445 [Defluviitaleaceae bacterium]|nr:hypothetical protein [Defluviitaleaceae bacterium]
MNFTSIAHDIMFFIDIALYIMFFNPVRSSIAIGIILAIATMIIAKTRFFSKINAEKLRIIAMITAFCGIFPIFVLISSVNTLQGIAYIAMAVYAAFCVAVGMAIVAVFAWIDWKITSHDNRRKIMCLGVLVYSVILVIVSVFLVVDFWEMQQLRPYPLM